MEINVQINIQYVPLKFSLTIHRLPVFISMKIFHFQYFAKNENDIIKAVMQLKEFLGVCDKEIGLFSV